MKKLLLALWLTTFTFNVSAGQMPASHVDLTSAILDFLSRTELCLASCQDAESAKAALPLLRNLKSECDKLAAIQQSLPEPTIQDYLAVQQQAAAFNTIWDAIRNHIERLEQSGIMSQEMRSIMHISPPTPENK